jgi:ribosomal-protein-alanine N-acetyltransferase
VLFWIRPELHNIAIHPEHQGIGLGSVMLDYFITNLPNEIKSIYLEVRLSNFRAIRLYQERGFVQVGERRDYYKTELGREDALLMCRDMATETP